MQHSKIIRPPAKAMGEETRRISLHLLKTWWGEEAVPEEEEAEDNEVEQEKEESLIDEEHIDDLEEMALCL